jgi:site-specific DNA-adenine methylase
MQALSARLRRVRVVCGDWSQVCGGNWQDSMGNVGMFFDPPYGDVGRDTNLYHHDSTTVAAEVNAWVLKRGDKPTYRIVLAGYYEEHENLLEHGWRVQRWKANGGYGNRAGNKNCEREALFFSPHCVQSQRSLFDLMETP